MSVKQMLVSEIFDLCRQTWGLTSQILMLAEESSELTQATLHLLRNNKHETREHLIEEMADVQLMMEEIAYYFHITNKELHEKRTEKLDRLVNLLQIERSNMCAIRHEHQDGCCAHDKDADCHVKQ